MILPIATFLVEITKIKTSITTKPRKTHCRNKIKNAGWIEDSTSELCSPILIIPKGLPHENKGYRSVVDLRQLNARTKSLQYMVPKLGEMWAKLRNAKFISRLDLRHGFWQMGLHPDSRHKTPFSCAYGTFQYRVLPMGLLTA
jgi:hypothetical protein